MTLEELIELDWASLDKLSDAELETTLKPYFPTTRPEMISSSNPRTAYISPAKNAAMDLLEKNGINIREILYSGRKKS
jgi:hypothetical protein